MKRFEEVFLGMSISQQLIHLLVSKIIMSKEREINIIEIQISNGVITYLMKDGLPKEQGNPYFLYLLGINNVSLKILI
ncbi:hypothetical protein JGS6364_11871 [[Clostridium] sordellii]|uniref:hypothetical protein n=1 Tax=Paraclostridium sordellii TaxID=1505 RepID=UPI000542CAA9|nr:hypothetical protein [Paeniclostridium sordellii]CEK30541.1 hypothetical protein JGS6364_11871 [[Clostridium] sordellii] [Paeniclostridium sordellii]